MHQRGAEATHPARQLFPVHTCGPPAQSEEVASHEKYLASSSLEGQSGGGGILKCSVPASVINLLMTRLMKGRDRSVGIATGYGLNGRGSNHGEGKVFISFIASRPALGPT
jgi:hypothetical protein